MLFFPLFACSATTSTKGPGGGDEDSAAAPDTGTPVPTESYADEDGDGSPAPDDCDDDDPNVHPGQPDAPYDGVDSDCDHGNDFDADGDCFMPPGTAAPYADYVARWLPDGPTFCVDPDDPFSDCLDLDGAPELVAVMDAAGLAPADVHRSTASAPVDDPPYDGVDQDCGKEDDYDDDGDAFVPDPYDAGTVADYAELWGYESELGGAWVAGNPAAGLSAPQGGDCDDADADRWPGALETLGDGVDQDCTGGANGAQFGFGDAAGDFDWSGVGHPEVARLGDHVLVLVVAEAAKLPTAVDQIGVALPFAPDAIGGAAPEPLTFPYFKSPFATLVVAPAFDAELDPSPTDVDGDGRIDPMVATLTSVQSSVILYTYQLVGGIVLQTAPDLLLSAGGTVSVVPTPWDIAGGDLAYGPDGEPYAVTCAEGLLLATWSLEVPSIQGTLEGTGGDTCFFDGAPGTTATFVACAGGTCERYSLDHDAVITDLGPSTDALVHGDQDGGWITRVTVDGAASVQPVGGAAEDVLTSWAVTAIDASENAGVLYVVAVGDRGYGPEVVFAFGDPAVGLTEEALPFDDPSVEGEVPLGVGIHADDERVAIAVTATTGAPDGDSVGWTFVAP